MRSAKSELSSKIKEPRIKMKFLALWKKISDLLNEDAAQKVCNLCIQDQMTLDQFSSMNEHELRENIELLGFLDASLEKVSAVNPERIQASLKKQPSQNMDEEKPVMIHKEKEESLEIIEYVKEIKSKLEKNKRFCKILKEEHFNNFIEKWLTYEKRDILPKSSLSSIKASNLFEYILQVDSAFHYSTSQQCRLRPTQALAIYCFISQPEMKRQVLQILTGEGKSTTIACLAAILTLKGLAVDIITTNQILARRDVEEKKQFFELLGLKVAHNFGQQPSQPKKCYDKSTVVYGTPHSFQVDFLYTQYKQKGTRNKRPYEVIIIDESDSMFVDEKQHQTLLSTTYTGFSELHMPMRIIWQHILTERYVINNQQKITMYMHGESENEIIEGEAVEIMGQIMKDIRKKFSNQIIPIWRMQFVELSLEGWIWSALNAAFYYKKKRHYLVENEKIVPIDFQNTGCLMNNVHWQNGLHQFLEMKHGLDVTTEGMTSNFISNIGYFCRYEYIFGMTGTLGQERARQFLVDTYQVDLLEIPTFKRRKLQELPNFLMYDEGKWARKILERVEEVALKSERSVLIICQSIQIVELLQQQIKSTQFTSKNYFRNLRTLKTGEEAYSPKVDTRQIIIATNVAGRGTDLKISPELKNREGLHVIITFIPDNLRVEMQARGRAGRNGEPGSAEIIACYKVYCENKNYGISEESSFNMLDFNENFSQFLAQTRDREQEEKMDKDSEVVERLKAMDQAFSKYCKVVCKIPGFQDDRAKREAIEQKWAIFLKKVEIKKMNNEQMLKEANKILDEIQKNPEGHYNPNHSVLRGIKMLGHDKSKAQTLFKQAANGQTNLNCKISGQMLSATNGVNMNTKNQEALMDGLKKLSQVHGLINQRKNIVQAVHTVSQSTNNDELMEYIQKQDENEREKLRERLKGQSQSIEVMPEIAKTKELKTHKIQKLTDIAEINVLDQISKHIDEQIMKHKQLKKGEWIQFEYEPLTAIIDKVPGKQKQINEAIQKLGADGLVCLPKAVIKKQKTPFWKRALVFCFGVLQICIGALIMEASGGSLASFGASMVTRGVQCCFDALFNPEVCNDLKKYFTEKAIEYTVDLALLGKSGIKELKNLGSKSLTFIKNKSMKQILETASKGIAAGLKKYPGNFEHLIKQKIFEGIKGSTKNKETISDKVNKQSVENAVKNPEIRKKINMGIQNEEKVEKISQKHKIAFNKNFRKAVRDLIENDAKLKQFLNTFELDQKQLEVIIHNAISLKILNSFDPKNAETRKQFSKKVHLFISLQIKNENSGILYLKNFKLDQKIRDSLQYIPISPEVKILEERFWNQKIVEEINKESSLIQSKHQTKQNQLNKKCDYFNKNQKEMKMGEIEKFQADYKLQVNRFNLEISQLNTRNKNIQKLTANQIQAFIGQLRAKGIISGVKVISDQQKLKELQKICQGKNFLRNAVLELSKNTEKHENMKVYQKFSDLFEQKIFESFGEIAEKAIDDFVSETSKSPEILEDIQKYLTKTVIGS